MLIIGAKGFAKEVLQVFHDNGYSDKIAFYDDINNDVKGLLFDQFPILKNEEQVLDYFEDNGKEFVIGIGSPVLRYSLYNKFLNYGGVFTSCISPYAHIGNYGVVFDKGCNIMTGSILTSDITIGIGVLINLNCTIGHDSVLDDFVELCPGVHISGNCKIGSHSFIGTNSTLIPNVTIGKNVTIGAGSVVTTDIPDNSVAVGIPAKVIRNLEPLNEMYL